MIQLELSLTRLLSFNILVNNTNNLQSSVQPENTVAETSQSNVEIHESVQFSDQAPVQEMNVSNKVVANNPYEFPKLDDYLSRVYPLQTFIWTSSDAIGDKVSEVFLPDSFYSYRAIAEKLSRFAYLKCNFHISVRVNGTKFHYGKLLVAFNVSSYKSDTIDYTLRDNIWSVSAFPHVICDAGENEVQEFDIPFLFPLDYYPLDPASASYGYDLNSLPPLASVFAYVLNPLSAGDTVPDISVTIYGNMTDIKLAGYANSVPTSVQPFLTRAQLDARNNQKHSILQCEIKERQSIETLVAQIGTNRMRLALPDLNQMSIDNMQNDVVDNSPNCNISFPPQYEVSSFNDIISKEALLYTGTITSNDVVGSDIFSWSVNPTTTSSLLFANGRVFYETPLSFISTAFTFWRGSINYKIQFVASQFHSLRLQLIYVPNGSSYDTTEPFELLSRVIDVQRDTEFKFSVPYTDIFPYTNSSYGRLYLKVVNSLTFKETPVPDIFFNIWISGGSDMSFHLPTNRLKVDPTTPSNIPYQAQIGTNSENPHSVIYDTLAPFDAYSPNLTFNKTEYRDLLNKPILVSVISEPSGTNTNVILGRPEGKAMGKDSLSALANNTAFDPWFYYLSRIFRFRTGGIVYNVIKYTTPGTDTFTQCAAAFLSYPILTNTVNTAITDILSQGPSTIASLEAEASFVQRSSDLALQPLVVKTPYYTGLNMLLNGIFISGASNNRDGFFVPRTRIQITTTSEAGIYLSGADDTNMHFQLGPPFTFIPS